MSDRDEVTLRIVHVDGDRVTFQQLYGGAFVAAKGETITVAPVRASSVPDTEPWSCFKCGHPILPDQTFVSVGAGPEVRRHKNCPRGSASSVPGTEKAHAHRWAHLRDHRVCVDCGVEEPMPPETQAASSVPDTENASGELFEAQRGWRMALDQRDAALARCAALEARGEAMYEAWSMPVDTLYAREQRSAAIEAAAAAWRRVLGEGETT